MTTSEPRPLVETSIENSILVSGGNINSDNIYNHIYFQTHTHYPTTPAVAPSFLLRCPLPSGKFVGRKNELVKLQRFFISDDQDGNVFILIGMGGCGKSQLSFKFMHHHVLKNDRYNSSMVFFIDAATRVTLEESYALIAKAKGVGSSAKDAIIWLSNTQQPSFILMDNADSPKIDFREYIPRSTNAHVLMTTRLQHAGRDYASNEGASIDLDALSLDEAEELLIKAGRLGPDRREGVRNLVQELHCHALAVAQAGAGISGLRLTVLEYTDQFRRYRTKLMDGTMDSVFKNALDGYPKHVASTFFVNYHELPVSSRDLLNLCGHLHHTGIVEEIFKRALIGLKSYQPMLPLSPVEETALTRVRRILHSFTSSDPSRSFDTLAFRRCIQHVLALSLIRYDESNKVYSIHPLIHDGLQRIVIDYLPTLFLLTFALSGDGDDEVFTYRIVSHVATAIQAQEVDSTSLNNLHPDIAISFGNALRMNGIWDQAEPLLRSAMGRLSSILGGAHRYTLGASNALA